MTILTPQTTRELAHRLSAFLNMEISDPREVERVMYDEPPPLSAIEFEASPVVELPKHAPRDFVPSARWLRRMPLDEYRRLQRDTLHVLKLEGGRERRQAIEDFFGKWTTGTMPLHHGSIEFAGGSKRELKLKQPWFTSVPDQVAVTLVELSKGRAPAAIAECARTGCTRLFVKPILGAPQLYCEDKCNQLHHRAKYRKQRMRR